MDRISELPPTFLTLQTENKHLRRNNKKLTDYLREVEQENIRLKVRLEEFLSAKSFEDWKEIILREGKA